jgi:hypothetical protein
MEKGDGYPISKYQLSGIDFSAGTHDVATIGDDALLALHFSFLLIAGMIEVRNLAQITLSEFQKKSLCIPPALPPKGDPHGRAPLVQKL